jgi:hypothetical protein
MSHKCTVPMDATTDTTGNFHYVLCGRKAKYKIGNWYVCGKHREHRDDLKSQPADLLEKD